MVLLVSWRSDFWMIEFSRSVRKRFVDRYLGDTSISNTAAMNERFLFIIIAMINRTKDWSLRCAAERLKHDYAGKMKFNARLIIAYVDNLCCLTYWLNTVLVPVKITYFFHKRILIEQVAMLTATVVNMLIKQILSSTWANELMSV